MVLTSTTTTGSEPSSSPLRLQPSFLPASSHSSPKEVRLTRTALELLAEHEKLDLVVDGEHTSTGDTTKNVGTSALEERGDALLSNDL